MGDDMSDAEYGEFNNCFRNITRFRKNNPNYQINDVEWDDLEKAHYADIKERDDRIKELEERILELLNPQRPVDHDRLVAMALRQSDSEIKKGGKK